MMPVLFVLLPTLAISACYRWECGSLEDTQCFSSSPNSLRIQVQACPPNTKCAINQMTSVLPYDISKSRYDCVALSWLATKKFPGELCELAEECLGGLCRGGICQGKPAGLQCTTHEECDVGLICSQVSKMCILQVSAGSACASDEECMNDSLCYNGQCALVMSLPNGSEFTGLISINAIHLCSSGYIANNQCRPAPHNSNAPDYVCFDDLDCGLIHPDKTTTTGLCHCGFNSFGRSYCQAKAGDSEFEPFKTGLLAVMKVTNKCHSSLSLSSRCPSLAELPEYSAFLNAYYLYYYRHAVIAIEDCVQNLMPFSEDYPYSLESAQGDSGDNDKVVVIVVVVVVLSVVLAAGIVCCLCLRKCAIDERNQAGARRRILREEMEEMPVRISRVIHNTSERPAEPSNPPQSVFQFTDIVLHPRNRRFLHRGIPVAQMVNQITFEPVELVDAWETFVARRTDCPQPIAAEDPHLEAPPTRSDKSPPSSNVSSIAF